MKRALLVCIPGLILVLACGSARETKPGTGTTSSSSSSASSAGTTAPQADVTVSNQYFVRDVWRNVRDISADTRSFNTGGGTAVAGVRGGGPYRIGDKGLDQVSTIPRAELEKSVAELRKILQASSLSAFDRSRYGFYLGACLVELRDLAGARAALQKAVQADRNGIHGKAAQRELDRLAKGSAR